ncbi:MAG: glycosyltransferase family 4 protein [Promethearchaeota archaeon]
MPSSLDKNRVKICILTSAHPPFDARIFHKEAKTLVKAGYKVVLIAQHSKEETVDGVRIVPLPTPKNRFERMTKVVWKLFKLALKEKADIYHFHEPELMPVGVGLKLFGKKVIYDVHEDYQQKILSKGWIGAKFRKVISFLMGFIEKACSMLFDYIITADSHTKTKFKKNKVDVIANFPPLAFMDGVEADEKEGPFKVIYVGDISENRGAIKIFETIEYLKHEDIEFHLLGRVYGARLIDLFNSTPRIKYHGVVPWEEVSKYLVNADVGLILLQPVPAYLYCPGENITKLFEYMSVGLPVIISNFPKLEETISEINCGVSVDPTDPKAIADSIESLYSDPDSRKQMGENGKKALMEKYNWEAEKGKLLDIYQKVLNK